MNPTVKRTSVLIPPTPFRRGDPPARNAELTIFSLGSDHDEIIPCLLILGEFNRQQLARFTGNLPVTITLPASYYDKSNAFVAMLRTTGTKFKIVSWSWVCPDELKDDLEGKRSGLHWCTPACAVFQIEEQTTS